MEIITHKKTGHLDLANVDPRHAARAMALQFLHQLESQRGENLEMLEIFLADYTDNSKTRTLARSWIQGTWKTLERIDPLIRRVSRNWELSRIPLVDLSNLRLAVYQFLECEDIPAKVVLDEAVQLARTYSTAEAPAFINGVLDAVYRDLLKMKPA